MVAFKRYERALHVHLIAIKPAFQNIGFGKKIMGKLHQMADAEQRDITLSSFKINHRAVGLYHQLGYDIEKEEEHFSLFRRQFQE